VDERAVRQYMGKQSNLKKVIRLHYLHYLQQVIALQHSHYITERERERERERENVVYIKYNMWFKYYASLKY